jgi:hypothetical protein
MPESVKSTEDPDGRSERAPIERLASRRGVSDPGERKAQIKPTGEWRCHRSQEKKTQIKPTDEMGNTLCDRRKGMVNEVLSEWRKTRGVRTKPVSAVASRAIRLDMRLVAVSIGVGDRGWP